MPLKEQQLVSNKVIKRLLQKHDDCNLSKLEDFITFNKQKFSESFATQNQNFLQACARICIIKEVEVDPKEKEQTKRDSTRVQVVIKDPKITSAANVKEILTTAFGEVEALIENEPSLIAVFKNEECVAKALNQKSMTFTNSGAVHTIEF